ncbi:MAG: hypothetical protein JWO36_3061 [Myxococcales bacterium]|nr:hypothetical protein [Myxococcales bacterium]
MPRMKSILLMLCVAATACAGGGDDWTKKPLKTVSGTAGGVPFSIELPDGMREKVDGKDVRYDFHIDDRTKTPEITVSAGGYAKTLDDYMKTEPGVDNWLRKETLPDGYVVSYENSSYKGKEDYLVYVYRTFGDKVMTCHARVTPWTKGAAVKDKVPLIEKMCLSMKLAK